MLFPFDARLFTVHAGKVFIDLGELVLHRRGFAEQAESGDAVGLNDLLLLAETVLQHLARLILFDELGAGAGDLFFELCERFTERGAFSFETADAGFEVLDLVFPARHALFGDAAFADLGFELAAGAFVLELKLGELFPDFGEFGFEPIADGLFFGALGIGDRRGFGELFERRGSFFEGKVVGLGLLIKGAEADADEGAEAEIELLFQFDIAFGFGGLTLERVHLARDLFEDVEDAGEILLGAFQLGFGEALAGLVLGDAGSFFNDGAAVIGLGAEDLADAALFDDGVAFRSKAGTHKDVLDVAEAGGAAVDQILALAGAEEAPRNSDVGRLGGNGGDVRG